jgi:hypothetical protein
MSAITCQLSHVSYHPSATQAFTEVTEALLFVEPSCDVVLVLFLPGDVVRDGGQRLSPRPLPRARLGVGSKERLHFLKAESGTVFLGDPEWSLEYNSTFTLWVADPQAAVKSARGWPPVGHRVVGYGGA